MDPAGEAARAGTSSRPASAHPPGQSAASSWMPEPIDGETRLNLRGGSDPGPHLAAPHIRFTHWIKSADPVAVFLKRHSGQNNALNLGLRAGPGLHRGSSTAKGRGASKLSPPSPLVSCTVVPCVCPIPAPSESAVRLPARPYTVLHRFAMGNAAAAQTTRADRVEEDVESVALRIEDAGVPVDRRRRAAAIAEE